MIAGFDRISKGLTGTLSAAERRARADAMAALLGEYRAAWRQMLSRLKTAKGSSAYASCRDEMIDHASGLRARDRLIANLVAAVRKGDAAAVKRAFAAQRARGAANRRLAAAVRACLKAAGPPAAAPSTRSPEQIPARLDLSSLCPKSVVRQGVTLVLVSGAQVDYAYRCSYALPTNHAVVPVEVSIDWWTPTSGRTALRGNCAEGVDRYSPGGVWFSGSQFLNVGSLAGFDDRKAILEKVLAAAEAKDFALPCDYAGKS